MSRMIAPTGQAEPSCTPFPGAEPGAAGDSTEPVQHVAQSVLGLAEPAWTPAKPLPAVRASLFLRFAGTGA